MGVVKTASICLKVQAIANIALTGNIVISAVDQTPVQTSDVARKSPSPEYVWYLSTGRGK